MASLAQKDVTQATVVRKLSSYARQNQTKKALWELDNIRRTIYILDYIDDPTLRHSVQKALNRGEAYHRMRRAISYVNSGKFRVKTEAEQQIWNDCSRLIANAIVYYNTLLLSRVRAKNWQQTIRKPSTSSRASHPSPGATLISSATSTSLPVHLEVQSRRHGNALYQGH